MRTAAALVALALGLALAGCKQEPRPPRTAPAAPAVERPFTPADLAAAMALDARLARVTLLASELQLAADDGPRALADRAASLEPRLTAAGDETERALAAVAHPGDRALAERAVEAARRWPSLARELRAAPSAGPAPLRRPQDELGRAVFEYRRARATLPVLAAPETGPAAAFSRASVELEHVEGEAGQRLPSAPRDEGRRLDATGARRSARASVARARDAAGRLPPHLQAPALRWVEAEGKAVEALLALGAAPEAGRRALSLGYLEAKADALDARAEYQRLRAGE